MTDAVCLTLTASRENAEGLAELNSAQTWALAQLLKRLSWAELRACALDDAEAYDASDAVAKLQRALADAGIAPR